VKLAQARLRPYGGRVRVLKTNGSPRLPLADNSCDGHRPVYDHRFISTFVLDLLPEPTVP